MTDTEILKTEAIAKLRLTSFGCQVLRARIARIQVTHDAPEGGDLDLDSNTITLPASGEEPSRVLSLAGCLGRYFAARMMEPYREAAHELDRPRVEDIAADLTRDLDHQFRAQIALEMVHRKIDGYQDVYDATRKRNADISDELRLVTSETLLEEILRLEIGALETLGLSINPSLEDHNWPGLDDLADTDDAAPESEPDAGAATDDAEDSAEDKADQQG
ncbi:MAG: hypothetical protein Alpg2KO_29820 [Alphaproteobacteria bacterium]